MSFKKIVTKIAVVILFGLLVLSFAIWGIGDVFYGGSQARVVAEIGEIKVDQQDFSRTLAREINSASRRLGTRLTGQQAQSLGLVQQVLRQEISRALVRQQAADLGVITTDEQVRARILEEPAFQDDLGNFSRDRFLQALQVSGSSEQAFVAGLKEDIQSQSIVNAVSEAVVAPVDLAAAVYAYQEERRIAEFVVLSSESVTDIPEPTDEDLQEFYESNAQNFMAPEYRSISFVRLDPEEFAKEVGIDQKALREEFEARFDDFVVPEEREIEQIVFSTEEEAKAAVQRISAGETFEAVAEALTGQAPISLGNVTKSDLLPDLAEPTFSAEAQSVSAPIKSPLGWHVLKIGEVSPRVEPTFEEVEEELADDMAMRTAVDSLISIANEFDDEMAAGATLEEAAASLNLAIQKIEAIDARHQDLNGNLIEGLPADPAFDQSLRETEEGETSLLTETADGGYFVLRVDGVVEPARRPFENVKERVAELWEGVQRNDKVRETAEALKAELDAGKSLADVAAENELLLETSEPLRRSDPPPASAPSPQLLSMLFQADEGGTVIAPTPDGQVIAKLLEIQPADMSQASSALDTTQENLAQSMQGEMLDQFIIALQQEYPVSVNNTVLQELLDNLY